MLLTGVIASNTINKKYTSLWIDFYFIQYITRDVTVIDVFVKELMLENLYLLE